ncbi:MAG: pyridoxal phosphate-dependent aminotransferase [Syntrophobacterales bacterium]|jgi:aspartate aminotransferase|nr:pyridoxal phosphate-dependent aminotransferase [Syntrophobacterales bacterium]
MAISARIRTSIENSSWIRRMFEEGAELKARLGADRVYDFTLGNPDLEPPPRFKEELVKAAADPRPGLHSYMPNAGLLGTRQALAARLSRLHHLEFKAHDLVVTCGASGGLNIILKALLDPGDEVVVLAPYFPEYLFYAENHGGVARVVETDEHFQLDLDRLAAALTPRTRAIIVNSPNNPTGQIYDADTLKELGRRLVHHAGRHGRPVYLVADEPYRHLVYDGHQVPSVFAAYPNTLLATSFSKDLSIPGERLGYVAVSPLATGRGELEAALVLANRILGFVNAPALMQRVVASLTDVTLDMTPYLERRDLFCDVLAAAGYDFLRPQGAFYLFPRAPGGDDLNFVSLLKEENILGVPGRGFGRAGYFRLAFCVSEKVIEAAAPGFARARAKVAG